MMEVKQVYFLGLKLSNFTNEELDNYIIQSFNGIKTSIFYGYSIGLFPKLKTNPELINICNSFDLMVTDGRILYLYMKLFNIKLNYDISIPFLTIRTLELANKYNKSVCLLGGTPKSNQIASLNLKKTFKSIKFVEGVDGFRYINKDNELLNKINDLNPDVLLIGMHTPFKEEFSFNFKNELKCKVIIPCGGMIDVFSGEKRLAPKWIKKTGLAWMYRFVQNPIGRFKLTFTYSYYFFLKLLPHLFVAKVFRIGRNKTLLDII